MLSDRTSQQLKQCYTLNAVKILTSLLGMQRNKLSINYGFSATSLGKGPCDGTGGTVKRQTRTAILTSQKLIPTVEVYAKVANKSCPNVMVVYSSKDEVMNMKEKLSKVIFKDCLTLPGTRKSHWFEVTDKNQVRYYDFRGSAAQGFIISRNELKYYTMSK